MEGISMRDLKKIDRATLKARIANMNTTDMDTMCMDFMNRGGNRDVMSKLKDLGVDCFAALSNNHLFKPSKRQAAIQLKLKRETTLPSKWSTSDWSTAIRSMGSAVKASDMRQISDQSLKELVAAGDLEDFLSTFKGPSKKRALVTRLKSAYGQPSTWDNSTLRQMGSLLGQMDTKTIMSIPPSQMRGAAARFKDLKFSDRDKKAAIGNQLIESLGRANAHTWTSSDVANLDQFIRSKPSIISKLSDSAIKGSLSDLAARKTSRRESAQLGRRLREMADYSDPTALDAAKVAQMGHLMQGMGRGFLRKMSASTISGSLVTLANVSFPRGEAREIMAKINGTPSSYDSAKVRELGQLVTGLEPSDLDQIPSSALTDSLDDIADKLFDKSQCRAIVKKVKAADSSKLKKMGALMSTCMGPDDVESLDVDELGLACSDNTPPTFIPDKATAKLLMGKVKVRFNSSMYTLTCMENWGRVAALGMDAEDFANLTDNGDFGDVIESLSAHEPDMDESQTKAIAMRIREFLQMDNDTAMMEHDFSTVEQMGVFMKHFNDSDLNKFNDSVKPTIARRLGEANMDRMAMAELIRMKNFALENVERDDALGISTNRSGQAIFDDNDIREMGALFAGMEAPDFTKMSADAISTNMINIQDKVRGYGKQKAVIDHINTQDSFTIAFLQPDPELQLAKEKNGKKTYFSTSSNIVAAIGLVGGMDSDLIGNMTEATLGDSLSDAAAQMEAREALDKKRDDGGFKFEVSDDERATMAKNKQALVQKAFSAYQASQTSVSDRKKRHEFTLTCSDIQVLGSNAVTLTTKQIEHITPTEFTDCTEMLGAITGWSNSQLTSLATRAKATYSSDVSTWSSANVKLLGAIIAGLTSDEISNLTLTSADVLTTMGTSTSFLPNQLSAGFAQFLRQAKGDSASSVTGDDLISIGCFACGASTADIGSFTAASYKTAATSIGAQSSCSSSGLEAYATLAKNAAAYGASSTWTSATITAIGVVIGGLSPADLSALTFPQIQSISTTTIPIIPADKLAAFCATQLAGFTSSQANAVTATQQDSMSMSQRASLVSVGASNLITDKPTVDSTCKPTEEPTDKGTDKPADDNSPVAAGNAISATTASLMLMVLSFFL